jgi:hypothetical protein
MASNASKSFASSKASSCLFDAGCSKRRAGGVRCLHPIKEPRVKAPPLRSPRLGLGARPTPGPRSREANMGEVTTFIQAVAVLGLVGTVWLLIWRNRHL